MVEPATRRTPNVSSSGWLTLLPPAIRFAFNGDRHAQRACEATWGPAFSQEACRATVEGTRATLWLGPEEYLLLDRASSEGAGVVATRAHELTLELEGALAGVPHSLVDVSHRQFALEVRGPFAATILNGACPLDLDLSRFPIGMCTRTVFAKADIVLWRTGVESFHLEVWRSFSGYVTGVLGEIAAEFHPGV